MRLEIRRFIGACSTAAAIAYMKTGRGDVLERPAIGATAGKEAEARAKAGY
jgi:hypothetical protein